MNKPRRKHYRDCSWGKHSHFKPGTHTCKFWKSPGYSNGLKKSKIQPLWSMTLQVQLPSGAGSDVASKGLDISFPCPWHASIFLEHAFLRVLLWSHPPCFEVRWVLCEGLSPPPFFSFSTHLKPNFSLKLRAYMSEIVKPLWSRSVRPSVENRVYFNWDHSKRVQGPGAAYRIYIHRELR